MRHSCSFSFSQGRAQTHISFFTKNNLQFIFEFTRQPCLRAISNKACLNKGMLKEVAQDFRVGYLVTSKCNKQWLIMNEAIKNPFYFVSCVTTASFSLHKIKFLDILTLLTM